MTGSHKALIMLALAAAAGSTLADGGTQSDHLWKAGQLRYVECVVSETDRRLRSDEPSTRTADHAINMCDLKLYGLGVDYARWLKAVGTMASRDIDTEVLRFARATRDAARRSMIGNLIVMRGGRDTIAVEREDFSGHSRMLAYQAQ